MRSVICGLAIAGLLGCGADGAEEPAMDDLSTSETTTTPAIEMPEPASQAARAVMHDRDGAEIGTAVFSQAGEGVQIEYQFTSLPGGEHGFHLHQTGSCETPTFESAGGHYNPTDQSHGLEHPQGPHAGDMPNLEVDAAGGPAEGAVSNERVTLASGGPNSLFDADGTALVVHADPDDHESQPSGNAGDRIACGVIEPA